MFGFKAYKDKRYWILLIIFMTFLVSFIVFGPSEFFEKTLNVLLFWLLYGAAFWSLYYLWKYFGDKKKEQ
ncbi:permease [Sporosarcina cyprini]|uniref:permease n=1 Tax=Sporosarcina cyprini TaxID=2910523 RepID=UPI001EDE48F5|nr:permease [Sporosarcina cyprini]MCG3086578.1 permease [Sporosarcina cyprini]